jgi:hypothetical protein
MTDVVQREENGRWLSPPRSPGRPKGPSASERVAAYIEPHMQAILDKAIELAKLGDPASMKLIADRYAPPAKPDSERVSIPGFSTAGTLQEKAQAVLAAAASGHCSAEAAERLLRVLDIYARAVTATEHEERLQALEQRRTAPALPAPNDHTDIA